MTPQRLDCHVAADFHEKGIARSMRREESAGRFMPRATDGEVFRSSFDRCKFRSRQFLAA
jgi:hypothetical protein